MFSKELAGSAADPDTKTVVIHQPDFLPYLGFFHRLLHADLLVFLDNVQFVHSSRGWTHRDKIKTSQGEKWLTVSVKKAPRDTPINEIEISRDTDWKAGNISQIRENYREAPYFEEIFPYIQELYNEDYSRLADFNVHSIRLLMNLLDTRVVTISASTLDPEGKKNSLLLDILNKTSATHYLSGIGARDYLDEEAFRKAGISVIWQDFRHPVYPQLHGGFVSHLSSIDLLFNCGIEQSRKILRSCL
jgi:hypothetical protein